jgi:hypothetical protein
LDSEQQQHGGTAGCGSRKGQIWSFDLISGITLMSILMLIFVLEWNSLALRWNVSSAYRELLGRAVFASDALFTTPGDPAGWERTTNLTADAPHALGLAYTRSSLDGRKLARLSDMNASQEDYALVLSRLGLTGYQMHMVVSSIYDGTVYYDYGRPSQLNNTAGVDRFVLLNGTTVARARLEVWK